MSHLTGDNRPDIHLSNREMIEFIRILYHEGWATSLAKMARNALVHSMHDNWNGTWQPGKPGEQSTAVERSLLILFA